jgi:hypothetical protein
MLCHFGFFRLKPPLAEALYRGMFNMKKAYNMPIIQKVFEKQLKALISKGSGCACCLSKTICVVVLVVNWC